MQLFYAPEILSGKILFDKEESNHCLKVLRKQIGDVLHVTDGKGSLVRAEIISVVGKRCSLNLIEILKNENQHSNEIILAVAFPKNNSRSDWLIEKAVELGVTSIIPLSTFHSERKRFNIERAKKIVMAAMKQSLHLIKPKIREPQSFSRFISEISDSSELLLADAHASNSLKQVQLNSRAITILIGPEGDFSNQEKKELIDLGCQSFHLGEFRLRTETAAITALAALNVLMTE